MTAPSSAGPDTLARIEALVVADPPASLYTNVAEAALWRVGYTDAQTAVLRVLLDAQPVPPDEHDRGCSAGVDPIAPCVCAPSSAGPERETVEALERRCVFCPIIDGDAPANIVERGEDYIAFVPLGPHVPGHVIFVPTRHLPDATTDPEVSGRVYAHAARYVRANGMQANIITSVGADATQSVMHLHTHVVPRGDGDGLPKRWPWLPSDAAYVAAAVDDARREWSGTEAVLRGEIRRAESALATFDDVVAERDALRAATEGERA